MDNSSNTGSKSGSEGGVGGVVVGGVSVGGKPDGAVLHPVRNTKFWNIRRVDNGSFKNVSPIAIYRDLCKVGTFEEVRKIGSGHLVIAVKNPQQLELLKKVTTIAGHEVVIAPDVLTNTSKGVIYCPDLINSSIDEILEDLKEQGVIEVKQVVRKVGGQDQPTPTYFLTFNKPDPPQRVRIAFYQGVNVRRFVPAPLRCFKCLRFGHLSKRCPQNFQYCVCGRPEHTGSNCERPMQCTNCGEDHSSRSPRCPEFQIEKEIQRVKVENKLKHPEAKALVKSSAYVMPKTSYAKKTSGSNNNGNKTNISIINNKNSNTNSNTSNNTNNNNGGPPKDKKNKNRQRKKRPATSPLPEQPKPAGPKEPVEPVVQPTPKPIGDGVVPPTAEGSGCETPFITPEPLPQRKKEIGTVETGVNTTPTQRPPFQGPQQRPQRQLPKVDLDRRLPSNSIVAEGQSDSERSETDFLQVEIKKKKGWQKGRPRKFSV